jgi:geranylgeranyl diphosphate synthase type II
VNATATSGGFGEFVERVRRAVDGELERRLPSSEAAPRRLHEAMRYSVFAGGKRLRPALLLLAGERFGAPPERLLPGAAALEMIHTYSLVHDDLPALDDDDLRRGLPTAHKKYDEATAILVGDALLTTGLTLLAMEPHDAEAEVRRRAVAWVGEAIGTGGMIGGQVADLEAGLAWPADAAAALDSIHRRKTGALLTASLRLGGLYAGASPGDDRRLAVLGETVGLLFQITDDILDVEGSEESLGKTPGKDARQRKLTFPGLYGLEDSRRRAAECAATAREAAGALGGEGFAQLVDHLARRQK